VSLPIKQFNSIHFKSSPIIFANKIRHFSSSCYFSTRNIDSINNITISPAGKPLIKKFYSNIYDLKSLILKENKNKSGIYKFINKLNGKFYIGSSVNLNRRFSNYFSINYISKIKTHLSISRAMVKYGYKNF
jgi:hypothetical protein